MKAGGKSRPRSPTISLRQLAGNRSVEIRTDPVPGDAPRGVLEQTGARLPPLCSDG